MKDEIKEILDKIKKQLEADEGMGFEIAKDFHKTTLNYKEIKLLLDYITNLEQENERFKKYARKYLKSKIDRKNEELELVKNKLIEEHNKCYDYKSRIDKALETLKDTCVDMPSTLLIETIDYARHQLTGGDE